MGTPGMESCGLCVLGALWERRASEKGFQADALGSAPRAPPDCVGCQQEPLAHLGDSWTGQLALLVEQGWGCWPRAPWGRCQLSCDSRCGLVPDGSSWVTGRRLQCSSEWEGYKKVRGKGQSCVIFDCTEIFASSSPAQGDW